MQNLTLHPKWSPSDKFYYGKFNSQITVGPTEYDAVALADYSNGSYRKIQNYVFCDAKMEYEIFTTVYTSDTDLIQHLMDNYLVVAISSPANDTHQNILEDVHTHTALRDKLYYHKYQFRLVIWRNHRMEVNASDFAEANIRLRELFSEDSKFLGGWVNLNYQPFTHDLPTVFTNDEASIMMFKIQFGNKFRLHITKAYVLNDLI